MGGGSRVRRSVVIGRANVGKTLFCIHFAQYIGLREGVWLVERADGRTEQHRLSAVDAERLLSGPTPHSTQGLQSVCLEFARGKGTRQLLLTDTTGLTEGVQAEPGLRAAMAQTLRAMLNAGVILHVVDAAKLGRGTAAANNEGKKNDGWDALDDQISAFGLQREGYVILANKMDLPAAKLGYRELCRRFSRRRVLPVSSLYSSGFREVKHHVWRLA